MAIWNNVTIGAWQKGILVYAMDQAQSSGFAKCPDGYCVGLATVWASLRWKLSDYAYNANTQELTSPDPKAVKVQKVFDAALASGGSHWTAIDKALAEVGLKKEPGRSQQTEDTVASSGLYNMIRSGSEGLGVKGGDGIYIVGLRSNAEAHAFAIANEADGWWRLFDANYGHFRLQGNANFREFLRLYLASGGTGYIKRYGKGWTTIFVKPCWM
jgi:hypothetical protein